MVPAFLTLFVGVQCNSRRAAGPFDMSIAMFNVRAIDDVSYMNMLVGVDQGAGAGA